MMIFFDIDQTLIDQRKAEAAACRIAGCAAEQSIYVGDRLHVDALASPATGMRGVWLDRRRRQRPATVQVVSSLTELCTELRDAP